MTAPLESESKVWFITGCSTGFGRLLAQRLLDGGHRVAATARNVEQLAGLKSAAPDRLLTAPLDVTRGAQIAAAVRSAVDRFGGIDVLVNNAGYGYFATHEQGDIDEIRRMFETNVFGLIRVTQAVLPRMRERRRGTIVNLSSVAGRVAFPRSSFYSATKFAVESMSESLSHEVRPFNIRVIVIEPGSYATDFGPRSAVRDAGLTDPASPYAASAKTWSDVAARLLPDRQDPAEVVDGIVAAVTAPRPPFVRIPFGRDARPLIAERESAGDAEFIENMSRRYYPDSK
ncbi:MAG: SDR family oxidoreductase [Phycisphaerales bacterium]|nr:SDR family oxidoreductase [Phycisphaerales bacterium]